MNPVRIDRCRHDIDELLHKKADARLSRDEATVLEQQMASCAVCQQRAALLEWAVDSLREDQKAVPAGLADAAMRRAAALPPSRPLRARSQPIAVRWLPAAAAVLPLAIVVLVVRHPATHTALEAPRVQVELQLASDKASSVAVAGDFNGWDTVTMKKGDDGLWRVRLSLSPGRYQYALLVDKSMWVADPRAATVVDSGFGGADSVLDLSL